MAGFFGLDASVSEVLEALLVFELRHAVRQLLLCFFPLLLAQELSTGTPTSTSAFEVCDSVTGCVADPGLSSFSFFFFFFFFDIRIEQQLVNCLKHRGKADVVAVVVVGGGGCVVVVVGGDGGKVMLFLALAAG